jgi:bacteriorhodopsin
LEVLRIGEMSSELVPGADRVQRRDRKFWIAMALFGVLAVVIWVTMGEGSVPLFGRQIEIRWIPLFVIGTFVFRAYIAREADKIRRGEGEAGKL